MRVCGGAPYSLIDKGTCRQVWSTIWGPRGLSTSTLPQCVSSENLLILLPTITSLPNRVHTLPKYTIYSQDRSIIFIYWTENYENRRFCSFHFIIHLKNIFIVVLRVLCQKFWHYKSGLCAYWSMRYAMTFIPERLVFLWSNLDIVRNSEAKNNLTEYKRQITAGFPINFYPLTPNPAMLFQVSPIEPPVLKNRRHFPSQIATMLLTYPSTNNKG